MVARPARLNASIAWLFMLGSTCFLVGSVPWYAEAVGGSVDGFTYFVGSLLFTGAAFGQLVQAQSPAMTGVDERQQNEAAPVALRGWLPRDHNWLAAATQFAGTLFFNASTFAQLAQNLTAKEEDQHVWRPDFFGSILFLVASTLGIIAVGGSFFRVQHSQPWRIAWLNMIGSIFFMASAITGFVLPSTGDLIDSPVSIAGTLLGAACFLAGAALMLPAWRTEVRNAPAASHREVRRDALPLPEGEG
jgi:hypothetical protein